MDDVGFVIKKMKFRMHVCFITTYVTFEYQSDEVLA